MMQGAVEPNADKQMDLGRNDDYGHANARNGNDGGDHPPP